MVLLIAEPITATVDDGNSPERNWVANRLVVNRVVGDRLVVNRLVVN